MEKRDYYQKRPRVVIFITVLSISLVMAAIYLLDGNMTDRFVLRGPGGNTVYAAGPTDSEASAKAFLTVAKVFLHPRCVNCHPAGDAPLQGDEGRHHGMNVKRGSEGLGTAGIRCSVCHQTTNQSVAHMPPGAPGWKLPPQNMPMIFEKRTPKQLCLQLKDPTQNGNMTLKDVLDHVRTAPLVLWAWNPGEGRTPVPISHAEFVNDMTQWVEQGASCPE